MDFKDPIAIIWTRRWLVLTVVIVGFAAGLIALKLSGPQYQATSSVAILSQNDAGHDSIANPIDMPTLLLSDSVLTRFEAMMKWNEPLKELRRRINASIDTPSTLMPIEFRAPTRLLAIAGANALADALQQTYRRISASRYDDLANYLSGALERERVSIDDTDRQLATLTAENPYEAQHEAEQAVSAQIIALNEQKSTLQANLQAADTAAELANRRIDAIAPLVRTEELESDANYKQLETQVAQESTQKAVVQSQFTNDYPGLPGLADEVTRTRLLLQQEGQRAMSGGPGVSPTYAAALKDQQVAQNSVTTNQQQLLAIDQQLEQAQSHLANLPTVGVKIDMLRVQRNAAENAYQIFAEQRSITLAEQAEAAALGSVVVAGYATEAQPALGKASLLAPIAAMFGFLVIGLTLPFALETIAPRMRRPTIEGIYGKPVIVTVGS
jgi:uncharacterized protein involved in exopolysaccharide biosynthesis